MSDSTEKPAGASGKYSSFPGEPVFTDSVPSDQDDGYKPLSILAILGAVLGGPFVLTLGGGFGGISIWDPLDHVALGNFLACFFSPFKLLCLYPNQSFR